MSRTFTPKGKPSGALQKIYSSTDNWGDAAFNEQDNEYFLVRADDNFDVITGRIIPSQGKEISKAENKLVPKVVIIKKASGKNSAYIPSAVWIPSTNQYAVGWYSYYDLGFYYAALMSDLKRLVKPKKFLSRKANYNDDQNILITAMIVLPNKIIWGCVKKAGCGKYKPMIFFTDFECNMLSAPGTDSARKTVYPGKSVKVEGYVRAAYNPSSRSASSNLDRCGCHVVGE